jgi:hypothetical protein
MYDYEFVTTVNGKTTRETHSCIQAAHTAMGLYAGKHGLNIKCYEGRWLPEQKSVMYKGDDSLFGVVGYVSMRMPEKEEKESPTPKIRKKRSS